MTTPESTIVPVESVEYLYGNWTHEDADGYIVTSVKQFPILKKTAKRIFYDAGYERTRSVDRQTLEQTGSVRNRSAGWWAPDFHLFANRADAEPAPAETAAEKVKRLKLAATAIHPDRGGDPTEFRAAYARYEAARDAQKARR